MKRNKIKNVSSGYSFGSNSLNRKDCNKYAKRKNYNYNKLSYCNSEGSFDYVSIFLGIISLDEELRNKSLRILFLNLEKMLSSDEFADMVTMIVSCFVFLYFYTYLFFNVTEFLKYILK